ncbi:MAG TPA: peptide ABC transporter substrate-binding protein [Ktedonobacterales bacterium]|jgi:peptide/nickel transport system substrate-binding protein
MKHGRVALGATLLMLLATIMAACGNPGTGPVVGQQQYNYQTPTHNGGTVVFSDWQFPDSTNPWFATSVVDFELIPALYGGPVTIGSDGNFLPDEVTEVPTLANGDVSKDGLTVTLKLRHDLKWSDGQELTADDFVYWLNVLLDPNTAAASTAGFDPDTLASYVAQDKYTLVLKYVKPFAPYLSYLPFAAPKHAWGSIADKDLANTEEVNLTTKVTSGPFVVQDFASQQSVTMIPNPNFTSTTLHKTVLDKLVFKGFSSKDALIAGYQAGETDHAQDFSNADIQKVTGLPGLHIAPAISYEHIDFNLQNAALQDINVRKAIEEAIDRCQIIQAVLNQTCDKVGVDTILPAPSPYYDSTIKALPFSLTQAKADMQAAGWDCSANPCTKAGKPFPTLNLVTTSGNTQRANVTEIVKQDLGNLGVPVNLDGQYYGNGPLFAGYGQNGILARGNYDLALFAYTFGVDADGALYPSFDSTQIPSDANPAGGNYERVNDPQVDQLLEQGRTTLDPAKRHDIYVTLQKLLIQDVYTIPMYLRPNITLTSDNVGNYIDNPTSAGNTWNVGDWFVKRAAQ